MRRSRLWSYHLLWGLYWNWFTTQIGCVPPFLAFRSLSNPYTIFVKRSILYINSERSHVFAIILSRNWKKWTPYWFQIPRSVDCRTSSTIYTRPSGKIVSFHRCVRYQLGLCSNESLHRQGILEYTVSKSVEQQFSGIRVGIISRSFISFVENRARKLLCSCIYRFSFAHIGCS